MTSPAPASILVTGGAGFVGSNLALHLRRQFPSCRITCLDNLHRKGSEWNIPRLQEAGCEFLRGDIRERNDFPRDPFELLIECSAEPSVLAGLDGSPDYLFQTNLVGTYNCLEQARLWKAKTIFLSTSRVYPIAPLEAHPWIETETRFEWQDLPGSPISSQGVSESMPMAGPRSLYGFTKFASELLIEEYRSAFGLQAIINRCGVIAGPWQFGKVDQGVVALWVLHHFFQRPLRYINYNGSGKQVRDILHVDDVCTLVESQIRNFPAWEGWCGNIAGGRDNSASLRELTDLCRDILGRPTPVAASNDTRQADLRIFLADCTRARQLHGWQPVCSVRKIVSDIASWVEQNSTLLETL